MTKQKFQECLTHLTPVKEGAISTYRAPHAYVVVLNAKAVFALLFNREIYGETDMPAAVVSSRLSYETTVETMLDGNHLADHVITVEAADDVFAIVNELKTGACVKANRLDMALLRELVERIAEKKEQIRRRKAEQQEVKKLNYHHARTVLNATGSVASAYRIATQKIGVEAWDSTYYQFPED